MKPTPQEDAWRFERRKFLTGARTAALGLAGAATALGVTASEAHGQVEEPYQFKLGMYLNELDLPFDEALAAAKRIGASYAWVNNPKNETIVGEMSDAEADDLARRVDKHGLEIFILTAGAPFKHIHLTDLDVASLEKQADFRRDFQDLIRSMEIARRIGVSTVGTFTFAWPGEYTAHKPTWPMRWLTRGGVIAEVDMEKLVKAFTLVAEQAEHYDVNVALSMMPWNYTNTTGNFRRVVERVGSQRLKVMWGPSDNMADCTATCPARDSRRP